MYANKYVAMCYVYPRLCLCSPTWPSYLITLKKDWTLLKPFQTYLKNIKYTYHDLWCPLPGSRRDLQGLRQNWNSTWWIRLRKRRLPGRWVVRTGRHSDLWLAAGTDPSAVEPDSVGCWQSCSIAGWESWIVWVLAGGRMAWLCLGERPWKTMKFMY